MKTKIFWNRDPEELTKEINKFEGNHDVKATQFQPVYLVEAQCVLFTAMIFFNGVE
jgi:hypothetical protein